MPQAHVDRVAVKLAECLGVEWVSNLEKVRIGLCQMKVGLDKEDNLERASRMIEMAAADGAELVLLPEMFNCPYDQEYFRDFAEVIPGGDTVRVLSEAARRNGVFLIGGSIPERDALGLIYNTSLVIDSSGTVIAQHRKVHLFDIQIEGGIQFQESASLTAGNHLTLVDTPWGKIGVIICYDIRFPEMTRLMAMAGARMIFVPAAFNMTTGPAHWELLFRSRAMDNQIFIAGCSPARNLEASYTAYGHSIVTGPWGDVICQLEEKEEYRIVEVDLNEIEKVRQSLPTWQHRRTDLYRLEIDE